MLGLNYTIIKTTLNAAEKDDNMRSLDEIMHNRANSLDLSREDKLISAQHILNELYPGKTRAKRLQDGILTVTTPSAAVAGDLRLQQNQVLDKLTDLDISQLKIQIG